MTLAIDRPSIANFLNIPEQIQPVDVLYTARQFHRGTVPPALPFDPQAAASLLTEAGLGHGAVTYDGDTPGDARRAAREKTSLLVTNPDMLHSGILPHHALWARLFARLRYVILDELHTYRGVFGSHLANVLRRLLRVAQFHGSSPTIICASATIGNPQEHAQRMVGRPVSLVDGNGAPAGPRRVLVYNPPVVNAALGLRAGKKTRRSQLLGGREFPLPPRCAV